MVKNFNKAIQENSSLSMLQNYCEEKQLKTKYGLVSHIGSRHTDFKSLNKKLNENKNKTHHGSNVKIGRKFTVL